MSVRQATPVAAIDNKDGEWECCVMLVIRIDSGRVFIVRTVSKDKFGYTSKIHSNSSEKVVITTQTSQAVRRYGTPELTQDQHRGRIRNKEAN